ncbi:hypothetical protein [Natronobeatus ordinarius]|uniref:hypothetical protein n=1 Tax=Natronobeatus ordinarius TaxID=2963433 RepID=UPI0020CCCE0C|nr:hypothetical protein [Natronobeatus ordinarius]
MVVLALLALVAVGMGSGLAAADTGAENETADLEVIAIDDATTITDWEIDDGRATVEIRTEISREVVLSDAVAGLTHEGASRVPEQRHDLERGTHTLTMDVETIDDRGAVSVATTGGAVRISSGIETSDDPFDAFGGASGLLFGIVMTVGLAGLGAVYVLRTEQTGVEKA